MLNRILKYLKTILPEDAIKETDVAYILPTICHNLKHQEASSKLYLYKNEDTNTPLFHCFTECGETFNVYQLAQKIYALQGKELSFRDAFKLINGKAFEFTQKTEMSSLLKARAPFQNLTNVKLPTYPSSFLEVFGFDNLTSHPWFQEGIDSDILRKFEIYFSRSYEGVIIPHRDYLNRLIGIRIRTYNENKIKSAKYMPLKIGNTLCAHPLSMNFFGLSQNEESIRAAKTVYLFEGEKSVLQANHMFKHDLSLAVCGSTISTWQIQMLIHYLEVENVFICFDKEYSTYDELFKYVQKITNLTRPLHGFMNVYMAIDTKNNFSLKESPVDRTKFEFEQMEFRKIG